MEVKSGGLSAPAGGHNSRLGGQLLSHAHRLLDEGNLKYAVIEGVSALEISLNEFVKNRLSGKAIRQ